MDIKVWFGCSLPINESLNPCFPGWVNWSCSPFFLSYPSLRPLENVNLFHFSFIFKMMLSWTARCAWFYGPKHINIESIKAVFFFLLAFWSLFIGSICCVSFSTCNKCLSSLTLNEIFYENITTSLQSRTANANN